MKAPALASSALALALFAGCTFDGVLVFQPRRVDRYTLPGNRVPPALLDEVELEAEDGVRLHAFLARHEDAAARPTVLYLHGQATCLDGAWDEVMRLWELGWNVLALDYRGYGLSGGEPTEAGLYLDALAGLEALSVRGDIDPARIVIWGYSMGSGIAAYAAAAAPREALVLEAPYTSMADLVSGVTPLDLPSSWLASSTIDTLSRVPDLECATVVAHGTEDERIPYWMGREVFAAAADPKRLVTVEGAGHADVALRAGPRIVEALLEIAPAAAPGGP